MKKDERDEKIRFIEILLTVGSLLGTALALSNVGQIWGLTLAALPLFIFFSIIYYADVLYSFRITRLPLDTVAWGVAYSFALVFSNVIAIPVVDNLKGVIANIFNGSFSWALLLGIGGAILVIAYFLVISKIIHKILTKGISMEVEKEETKIPNEAQKISAKTSEFKKSMGIAIVGLGATIALFGLDKLGITIPTTILQAYVVVGFIVAFAGMMMTISALRK